MSSRVSTVLLRRSVGEVGDGELEVRAGVERLRPLRPARLGEVEVLELGGGEEGEAGARAPARAGGAARGAGQPSNGVPSRLEMSQNARAGDGVTLPARCETAGSGRSSGPGCASTSLSCTRLKPSIAEPSKVMPSSRAFSSSAGVMLKVFGMPSTSVNQSWMNRTPRSSTVRSTYSRWLCTPSSSWS